MVIKKSYAIGIFIFLNLILLSFASGAAIAAWKDSCCLDCALPWGGSIHSDLNIPASLSSSVPCGSTCTSETRTCSNGTLSGSYTSSSCYVEACCDNTCYACGTYTECGNYCGDCPPPACTTYSISGTAVHRWNQCMVPGDPSYNPASGCPAFSTYSCEVGTCSCASGYTTINYVSLGPYTTHGTCIPCVNSYAYYYITADCTTC